MTEKIPVSNTTAMPIYVAGLMIPPGETRHFDAAQVPAEYRPVLPPVVAAAPPDPLDDLLGHSVKDVVARLPELSDTDLERLGDLEQAKGDDARKTLLGAIAEAMLERSAARQDIGAA